MPAAPIVCPYCHAKLRLAGEVHPGARAKCRVCKNSFDIAITLAPAAPPAGPLAPLTRPEAPAPAARPQPAAPVAVAPPPLTPPPEPPPPPPGAYDHLDLSSPPPLPATRRTPRQRAERRAAARRRLRQRVEERSPRRLKPYEVTLAVVLVVATGTVLAGFGWSLYLAEQAAVPAGGELPDASQPVVAAEVAPAPVLSDPAARPLPRRLIGTWELRADDDKQGWMELRADGSLAVGARVGGQTLPEFTGGWSCVEEDGDRYVLELGSERGGLGTYRVTIVLTSPDAFTQTEMVRDSVPSWETQRFVRAPAGPEPPPGVRPVAPDHAP